jgi:hypothetical protein
LAPTWLISSSALLDNFADYCILWQITRSLALNSNRDFWTLISSYKRCKSAFVFPSNSAHSCLLILLSMFSSLKYQMHWGEQNILCGAPSCPWTRMLMHTVWRSAQHTTHFMVGFKRISNVVGIPTCNFLPCATCCSCSWCRLRW